MDSKKGSNRTMTEKSVEDLIDRLNGKFSLAELSILELLKRVH